MARPLRRLDEWVLAAIGGLLAEIGLAIALHLTLAALDASPTFRDEPATGLLEALLGFLTFGAVALAVSIDLYSRYAEHFGSEVAQIIGLDDPARDRILRLIVFNVAASLAGLMIAALTPVHPALAAVGPAVLALIFVVMLIGYIAGRVRLLRQDRLRAEATRLLVDRLDRERVAMLAWKHPPVPRDRNEWRGHEDYLANLQILADLVLRLLERHASDDAGEVFDAFLQAMDDHAQVRRGIDEDLSGPTRTRHLLPFPLGDEVHRRRPDWVSAHSGPASPSRSLDGAALWFEDIGTEVMADVLRKAIVRRDVDFLIGALARVRSTAIRADPLFRMYLAEVLAACAEIDNRPTSTVGAGRRVRQLLGTSVLELAINTWRDSGDPAAELLRNDTMTVCQLALGDLLDAARTAGDETFAAGLLQRLRAEREAESWMLAGPSSREGFAAELSAFRNETGFERLLAGSAQLGSEWGGDPK